MSVGLCSVGGWAVQEPHGQTDRHARAIENITFATPLAGGINTDLRTVAAGENLSGNNSL